MFTRKANTDVSYLACARLLESAGERIYPQFATHNAHTIAHVAEVFGGDANRFEFQRLHGMGAELYDSVVRGPWGKYACRVYAPVGAHEDPVAVSRPAPARRTAPTRRSSTASSMPAFRRKRWWPIPSPKSMRSSASPHPRIPLPVNLFAPERANSAGFNFADGQAVDALLKDCQRASQQPWSAAPVVSGQPRAARARRCSIRPTPLSSIGSCIAADAAAVESAIGAAVLAQEDWDAAGGERARGGAGTCRNAVRGTPAALVARCVSRSRQDTARCHRRSPGGGGFPALLRARAHAAISRMRPRCPARTGERNLLRLRGKGVFGCISPWNFPLAIYTGQIAAALAAGNASRCQARRTDAADRGLRHRPPCCRPAFRRMRCTSCPEMARRWAAR